MANTEEHIVKSFDDDLNGINALIGRMGGLAEAQLDSAVKALVKRDDAGARQVIESDKKIDELEMEVDALVVRMLALRQPVANDLREVVSALKISSDIERIGDYAKNIAKRSIALNKMPHVPTPGLPRMAHMVQRLIKDVLDARVQGDKDKAIEVWRRDQEVDDLYNSLFRELLTYMMEDPRNITACTHLLFMAKNIERMGDLATNIAETIHFSVTGKQLGDERPKGDETSFAVHKPVENS